MPNPCTIRAVISNIICENCNPSVRHAGVVALEGRCFIGSEFPWREPDARLADGSGVQLADAPHVHLEDDDTEEVAVFPGFALADGRGVGLRSAGFGERVGGLATAAGPVPALVGLHLDHRG